MFWKSFGAVFISVFLAELGDKTQLATMSFAAEDGRSPWAVFLGSASALTLAAGIGVLAGDRISSLVSPATIKLIAGFLFIVIGIWTIFTRS
ncbi:MAG: TMEM165/GDT1 family protein [Leptospirales bacterium]|nr:TMEM165/GDT1 family protein [Leptospirales bacterium]